MNASDPICKSSRNGHLPNGRHPDITVPNGFIEAFNSKLRAECLNAHWFLTLEDARKKLENWCRHYNEDRPHSAIGYNVPIALHNPDGVISPPLA